MRDAIEDSATFIDDIRHAHNHTSTMLRIALIGKYPPIEGGVSSGIYWLARGLGKKGVEVHVITNAFEVEEEWRQRIEGEDLRHYQPSNVFVHNTDPFILPFHIPFSKAYAERLASVAIETVTKFDLAVIDAWYLLPYGVSGLLCKMASRKPLILRYTGSDITRLCDCSDLQPLLNWLPKLADKVVSTAMTAELESIGVDKEKVTVATPSVDTEAFNPRVKPLDFSEHVPRFTQSSCIIAYVGKNEPSKGLADLLNAMRAVESSDYTMLLVTGGDGIDKLKRTIEAYRMSDRTILMGFVPPWKMPQIIRASTCVVVPEHNFPVAIHAPILPREVLACGTCLMLSTDLWAKQPFTRLKDNQNAIIFDARHITDFSKRLNEVVSHPDIATRIGQEGSAVSQEIEDFTRYVERNISVYENAVEDRPEARKA